MELQDIQEKNNLLVGTKRKIVFWYDDDASYVDDIDNLQLVEGSKVIKLTGNNYFATKLLIENQNPETSYLGRDGLAINAKLVNVNVDNAIVDEDGDICVSKAFGMHGFAIIEDSGGK